MAAASRPKIDPEAPRVAALPMATEAMNPTAPEMVKMANSRHGPKSSLTSGPSWRTHMRLKKMWSRLPWR